MSKLLESYFILWGVMADSPEIGLLFLIVYPVLFIFGLYKNVWNKKIFRLLLLIGVAMPPIFSFIGLYLISRPTA